MDMQEVRALRDRFESTFGHADGDEFFYVRSPGRTEIAGNHTDHEGGTVIAGAVNRYVHALFSPNETLGVRLESEGHTPVELDLSDLTPQSSEHGTSKALVRGIAAGFAARGYVPHGFDAVMTSDVPAGSGLSSSAAFELAVAQACNVMWAKGVIAPEDLALMAQAAERDFFGKPCGLMDQASVALGGIQHMSFADPLALQAEPINFDFADAGYAICLVAVGADHSTLIGEYAAVPGEMQAVAKHLGYEVLDQLGENDVIAHIPELREALGDRAVLRALHYYREDRLVSLRAAALKHGDIKTFLEYERLSGASSAMYLQNIGQGVTEQPAMLALALAEELLHGAGACARIHGGGFGGTIQVFVPLTWVDEFTVGMNAVFGEGACQSYAIDHDGARAWRL